MHDHLHWHFGEMMDVLVTRVICLGSKQLSQPVAEIAFTVSTHS